MCKVVYVGLCQANLKVHTISGDRRIVGAQIQRAIVTLYSVEKADVTVVVRRSAS